MSYKNIYYIILLSFAFTLSCDVNNVIEEKPRDFFAPGQFFQSDDQAIAGVNGVYEAFSRNAFFGSGRSWAFWVHPGTDLARPAGGREVNFPQHVYSLSAATANINFASLEEHWLGLYRTVGDANMVINRVENNENLTESTRNRVLGEAKFLRAYLYYWLTNFWGGVPLWTDELDIESVKDLPRASVEEVRDQMVSDLLEAERLLPNSYSGADLGRANKWAAKMLLTKVYLWQKDWQNARDTAEDIILNSHYRLLENFEDIFGRENEFNDENIWEMSFIQDLNGHNTCSKYTPRGLDEPEIPGFNFNGFGLITAAEEFVNSFHPDDERLAMNSWHGAEGIEANFYYVLKYIEWGSPRGNCGINDIIFRLADAYLMSAEAENELNGPTSAAYDRINAVRQRAGVPILDGLSQQEFREAIMDERKWELSFEYHRRWDLNRWDKLVEAVQSLEKTNPRGAENVQPHHQLVPILPSEIEKNPNLEQNPGY